MEGEAAHGTETHTHFKFVFSDMMRFPQNHLAHLPETSCQRGPVPFAGYLFLPAEAVKKITIV